jgi:FAD synthase
VTLELVERIRDEKRFPSKEALVEQIHHDMKTARDLLA